MDRNVMARIIHQLQMKMDSMDRQLVALSNVLKDIVGKELMRGQALHKVLMDKKMFTDEELTQALKDMMAEAKADLEKEQQAVAQEKQKAVEILVPNTVKAESNQDPTPTPAVIPVEAPSEPPAQQL